MVRLALCVIVTIVRTHITCYIGMYCGALCSLSPCPAFSISMGFLVEENAAVVWRGLMVCATVEVFGDVDSCKYMMWSDK